MKTILQTDLAGVPEIFPMRELHENQAPQRWGGTTLVLPTYKEYNNDDRLSLSLLPCFDLSTDEFSNEFTYEITREFTNAFAEFAASIVRINLFTQRLPQQVFNTLAIGFQNSTHFNNFFGYPQCTDDISCPSTAFETIPRQEHVKERITLQPVVRLVIIVCLLFLSFVLILRQTTTELKSTTVDD